MLEKIQVLSKSDKNTKPVSPSVFMEQLGSFWTNFHEKLKFEHFSKICRKIFKFYQNLTRIQSILHDDQYSFMLISHVILLRVRNTSEKMCRENQNTHFISDNLFPDSRAVCEIMRGKKYGTDGQATVENIIRRTLFVCW
jgi:hypothetical protein